MFHHPTLLTVWVSCTIGLFVIGIPGTVDNTEVWLSWLGLPAGADGRTTAHWTFQGLAFVFLMGLIGVTVLSFITERSKKTGSKKTGAIFASPREVEELQEIALLLKSADDLRSVPKVDKGIEVEGWRVEARTRFMKINQRAMAKVFSPCPPIDGDDYLSWGCKRLRSRRAKLRGRVRALSDPSDEKQQRTEQEQSRNDE